MVCERQDAFASACALARAFPLFTHRAGASRRTDKTVTVEFFLVGQDNGPVEVSTLQVGVRTLRPCPRARTGRPAARAVWGALTPFSGERGACRRSRGGPQACPHARALAPCACARLPASVLLSSVR